MRKEDKGVIVAQLGELLAQYPHFYLVDVEGMNASSTSALRRKCFQTGLKMVVVKNTLLRKALEAKSEEFEPMFTALKGTTAILFTEGSSQQEGYQTCAEGCICRRRYLRRCRAA